MFAKKAKPQQERKSWGGSARTKKNDDEQDVDALLKQVNKQHKKNKQRVKSAESRAKKAERDAQGGGSFWKKSKSQKKPATLDSLLRQINEQNKASEEKAMALAVRVDQEQKRAEKAEARANKAEERAAKAEAKIKELEHRINSTKSEASSSIFSSRLLCW